MLLLYPLLLTGALGGALLSVVLQPIEFLKTRMQMRQELVPLKLRWYQASYYRFAFRELREVINIARMPQGLRILRVGSTPMFLMGGFTATMRLATYEYAYTQRLLSSDEKDLLRLPSVCFCGLMGALSQMLMNPTNVMKTKLHYWSICQSSSTATFLDKVTFMDIGKVLHRKLGWKAFKIGWLASASRGFVASVNQLVCYQVCKRHLLRTEAVMTPEIRNKVSFTSAAIASFVSTFCVSPFDIILTRMHAQPFMGGGLLYRSFRDAYWKIMKYEGYQGFYKGITHLYIKHGSFAAFNLLFWDIWKDEITVVILKNERAIDDPHYIDKWMEVARFSHGDMSDVIF